MHTYVAMYVSTCMCKCIYSCTQYIYTKQKHLGCKKDEANQKQQLSGYKLNVTKSFDIS